MKKQVAQYITAKGGQSFYSGNLKTMFVKGLSDIQILLLKTDFPNLPFKVVKQTNLLSNIGL